MKREQALCALRLADGLPEKLGTGYTFYLDGPCCAVGHMAVDLGCPHGRFMSMHDGESAVKRATGLDTSGVVGANDGSDAADRRAAVIAEVERQVAAAGFDPAELREAIAGGGPAGV